MANVAIEMHRRDLDGKDARSRLPRAPARFAEAYAVQNERDFQRPAEVRSHSSDRISGSWA